MTSALVIGGKGLLGSAVAKRLLHLGVEVVCLEPKATPGRLGADAEDIEIVVGDVRDPDGLQDLLGSRQFDVVLPLHFLRSEDVALELEVMVRGMWNIFDAAGRAGVRRVPFPSSIRVYGAQWRHGEVPLNEDSPCLSTRRYGSYKRLTEILGQDFRRASGTEIVAARVPIVYGPGIREGGGDVVTAPYLGATGQDAVLPHHPDTKLCVAHTDEVADVFVQLALNDDVAHDLYEIGGVVTSYGELGALTETLTGVEVTFDPPQVEDRDAAFAYLTDNQRLRTELGIEHRPIDQGITEFIKAIKES